MSDFTDDIFDIGDEHPNTPSWILFFVVVIFGLWYLSSCKDPQPKYPAPIIYSSEDACQELVTRSRIRIDSFMMVWCATTDTAVWRKCEDSIQATIRYTFSQIDTTNNNYFKYVNTHYSGRKIPCAIGDSIMIFYKLTPKG